LGIKQAPVKPLSGLELAKLSPSATGWINRRQLEIIEFRNAQIRALLEKLGRKRILLTDDQRRPLAVKGKALLAAALGGPLSNGTVSVEMNPSTVGGGSATTGAFNMSLVDSTTGTHAVRINFHELTNNSGDFQVFDADDQLLATGMALDNFPAAFGRWYKISVTIRENGTMDVSCDDIGPTSNSCSSGLTSVDTLRLLLKPWQLFFLILSGWVNRR
jgi:hypothetical protein